MKTIWDDLERHVLEAPEYFKGGLRAQDMLNAASIGRAQADQLALAKERLGPAGAKVLWDLKNARDEIKELNETIDANVSECPGCSSAAGNSVTHLHPLCGEEPETFRETIAACDDRITFLQVELNKHADQVLVHLREIDTWGKRAQAAEAELVRQAEWRDKEANDLRDRGLKYKDRCQELEAALFILKNPSDGRCMEIAALRQHRDKLNKQLEEKDELIKSFVTPVPGYLDAVEMLVTTEAKLKNALTAMEAAAALPHSYQNVRLEYEPVMSKLRAAFHQHQPTTQLLVEIRKEELEVLDCIRIVRDEGGLLNTGRMYAALEKLDKLRGVVA